MPLIYTHDCFWEQTNILREKKIVLFKIFQDMQDVEVYFVTLS